jgi:tripartite-type tricarboxylate transporter receptor subunit TctC
MNGLGISSQVARLNRIAAATAIVLAFVTPWGARAQDFYQGKTLSLYVGSGAGGAYDTYARLVARHYSRHIPGHPGIVVTCRVRPAAR